MSVLKLRKDDGTWEEINTIQGPAGPQGPQGPQGEVPNLATVATSGSYNDLIDKPDISGGASTATEVSFDDTTAQIGKNNVQEAIEYLADEAVDSTSVQEQIDTSLYDYFTNRLYQNPQENFYFFNPEEIYKITPDDGINITRITDIIEVKPYKDIVGMYNTCFVVKWERESLYISSGNYYSNHDSTLLKNHYYLCYGRRVPKVDKSGGKGLPYTFSVSSDSRNLSQKDTSKATFIPRFITIGLSDVNGVPYHVYIYDVTPYFQIAQHEQEIATLKAQVATLLNNNPTTGA